MIGTGFLKSCIKIYVLNQGPTLLCTEPTVVEEASDPQNSAAWFVRWPAVCIILYFTIKFFLLPLTILQATIHAIEAGFDGVETHNSNGCLLDQCFNTSSNQRSDDYGGSVKNRARLTLQVVDAVVNAIGAERTAIRFAPGSSFQGMEDQNPIETWSYVIQKLQERHSRLAYLHLIEPRLDGDKPNSVNSLDSFRKLWKGRLISAGGFSNSVDHAVDLAERTGNLIAFGRMFIANPDLPERIKKEATYNSYDGSTFYTYDAVGYTNYSPLFTTSKVDDNSTVPK